MAADKEINDLLEANSTSIISSNLLFGLGILRFAAFAIASNDSDSDYFAYCLAW